MCASQMGGLAYSKQALYMNSLSGGCNNCSDNIPGAFQEAAAAGNYTCAQQVRIMSLEKGGLG